MKELDFYKDKYYQDRSEDSRNNYINKIIRIDKENVSKYLDNIRECADSKDNIVLEDKRLRTLISNIQEVLDKRNNLINISNDEGFNINFNDIPNANKLNSLINEEKVIGIIININDKLTINNKDRAFEILSREEFKHILLRFSLISSNSDDEVSKYIDTVLNNNNNNNNNNRDKTRLRVLDTFYELKDNFSSLNIPIMGLDEKNDIINLDNVEYFK